MEIGISSACFYPQVCLEDSIKLMKKLGFDRGELFFNCPSEFEEEFVNKLVYEKEKYNFTVNSIHAFSSFFEPYLFDSYKRRRDDMLKYFKQVCLAGKKIGANSYTFHGMRRVDNRFLDLKLVGDIYNELIYISSEIGIKLAQENVSWCMSSDINFLNMLKEKCRYPISFTLDIKQAYKAGVPIEEYIKLMNKDIVNLHINDKDSINPCLLPGKGEVDYMSLNSILKEVDYRGTAIIEVYSDNYSDYKELVASREYLKEIL
ncbi:sugar phosphate isomerase/epimerase family protein [Clostridium sp. ZS2-4]|uniref:sugar phosphate isomerase/epimerase family protein n=1 Tax=Clostridium sp. ZS2-4 TaxID=2987703 RepID=UPI00227B4194|nr:sugar phosphate isomerase/epimerase [Clostridium sp. ZS2-4]MCY6355418.1 sugar phosphate isomerase/epimerase [Clostridium sp. ZS2-4]